MDLSWIYDNFFVYAALNYVLERPVSTVGTAFGIISGFYLIDFLKTRYWSEILKEEALKEALIQIKIKNMELEEESLIRRQAYYDKYTRETKILYTW
jgi:hypothetical protein